MRTASAYDDLLRVPPDTTCVGREIVIFDVIDSTNTYALDHGGDGLVVVADRQTAGRGRQGRAWHSAPGLGLWFTVALEGLAEGLSFAAGIAVRDALAHRAQVRVKWPNDLLCNGKKVCGILVEHRSGRTALGIGINVHHRPQDFPPELRARAGSLESEAGGAWNRSKVLRAVLTELDRTIMLLRTGKVADVHRAWVEACDLVGRTIRCGDLQGRVTHIDERGALVIAHGGARHILHSGDIHVVTGD